MDGRVLRNSCEVSLADKYLHGKRRCGRSLYRRKMSRGLWRPYGALFFFECLPEAEGLG